jgi:2-oxoglutarate/2-oxoacid ferredoxin oxidoreductase subunit beta
MKYYKQSSRIRAGATTAEAALSMQGDILVGKFVDRDRPDYRELMRHQLSEKLGDRYQGSECSICG